MALGRYRANDVPLSPVSFLARSAKFLGHRTAVIYGERSFTYREFSERVQGLSAALKSSGVSAGDRVAVLAPNTPPMLEAHYGIPMIGAVLTPLSFGYDASTLAYSLRHADVRLLICDREFLELARRALHEAGMSPPIILIHDAEADAATERGTIDYESYIGNAPRAAISLEIEDERELISLLYTSGTTGTPKGVVHTHRGAYLASMSNALSFGLDPDSVYLWTWPMFHCHGLSFTWAVTAVGGAHVCLREVDAASIFDLIARHHITHFSAAPTVLGMLANHPGVRDVSLHQPVNCNTGGAPPPPSVIRSIESMGIEVTHQYGCTEGLGPLTMLLPEREWDQIPNEQRFARKARQGTPTPALEDLSVADPETLQPVARDGQSLGEVMVRGNTVMAGYLDDSETAGVPVLDDWFHTGDIAVWHTDASIEIKDRSKDMIVSRGERISSVEIEEVLYRHPAVLEAAVVAKPDAVLGSTCSAFVALVPGGSVSAEELTAHCRSNLEAVKVPTSFDFRDLPKTTTGKIKKSALRELAKRPDGALAPSRGSHAR